MERYTLGDELMTLLSKDRRVPDSSKEFTPAKVASFEPESGGATALLLLGGALPYCVVVIDTETDGLYPHLGHRPFLTGLAAANGKTALVWQGDKEGEEALRSLLADRRIIKVGHNLKFDIRMLRAAGYNVRGPFIDTMVLAHLADERLSSYALKRLAANVLGERTDEEDQIKVWLQQEKNRRRRVCIRYGVDIIDPTYKDLPKPLVERYLKKDLEYTMKLLYSAGPRILRQTPDPSLPRCEMAVIRVVADMEDRGIMIDTIYFKGMAEKTRADLSQIQASASKLAGKPINLGSSTQLSDVLFNKFGLKCQKYTDKGNPCFDSNALPLYDHPLARLTLHYRHKLKLCATYYEDLAERGTQCNGIVHPSFKQTGAITGRFSCADPNLQNIPRKDKTVRAGFICRPEFTIYYLDYSQIEMRVFAHYANAKELIIAIKAGKDTHTQTAHILFGEQFDRAKGKLFDILRFVGKTINFGIIYGMGRRALRIQLRKRLLEELEYFEGEPDPRLLQLANLSESDAAGLLRQYFRAYPDVRRFMDTVQHELYRGGQIVDAFGRIYHVPICEAYKAVNYLVQGTAAGVAKRAMVRVHKELLGSEWRCGKERARIINMVHDELQVEVPKSVESRLGRATVAAKLRGSMEDHSSFLLPMTVDVAVSETNWAEKRPLEEQK